MKKLFSFITTLLLIAASVVFLITENPNVEEFSKWYVNNNPTEMGAFFDSAYEGIVRQQTHTKDYLIFTVFEIKELKYVGLAGHFWGRNTIEEATQNATELLENVQEQLEKETTDEQDTNN